MAWIVKRRRKTGVFWYVRYSIRGRRAWLSAGRSKSSAEKIKAKVETEIAEGRWLDRKTHSDWTLDRLKGLYLERMEQLRPRSARWRKERLDKVTELVGPQTPIEQIRPETLDRYVHARLSDGRATATVKGEVAILRHALRLAASWSETGLSEYRLEHWKAPKARPARKPVFLTASQVGDLLVAAKARGGHPYLFFRVFLETGARPGEILSRKPADVRLTRDGWAIWFETLKNGVDRLAPIPEGLARELQRALPFDGSGQAKDRYKRFWRGIREDAGLAHIRPYDIRHTAISDMLERGVPPRAVQRIVGHKSFQTTERYAHFSPDARLPKPHGWKVPRRVSRKRVPAKKPLGL